MRDKTKSIQLFTLSKNRSAMAVETLTVFIADPRQTVRKGVPEYQTAVIIEQVKYN